MGSLGEYVISLCAAAFVCGILNAPTLKGPAKEILKIVSGLFLAFCVISPISNIRVPDLMAASQQWQLEAEAAAEEGEALRESVLSESINKQLTAYILDKAGTFGLHPEVQVILAEDGTYLPKQVLLSGDGSKVKIQQLIRELSEDLGITKEEIQWTGKE